jgi:hypothetical protein
METDINIQLYFLLLLLVAIIFSQHDVIRDNFNQTIYSKFNRKWFDPYVSWKEAYKKHWFIKWLLLNPLSFLRDFRHLTITIVFNLFFVFIWFVEFSDRFSFIGYILMSNLFFGFIFSIFYKWTKSYKN